MENYKEETLGLLQNKYEQIEKNREQLVQLTKGWMEHQKQGKRIVIFGAGAGGKYDVYSVLKKWNLHVDFFCDNDKKRSGKIIIDNIKCISYDDLLLIRESSICFIGIGVSAINKVYEQLRQDGFMDIIRYELLMLYNMKDIPPKKIESKEIFIKKTEQLFSYLEDENSYKIVFNIVNWLTLDVFELNNDTRFGSYSPIQYFGENAKKLFGAEYIIDCGAYNGDSLRQLIENLQYSKFSKYICYEMDYQNYRELCSYVKKLPNFLRHKIVAYNFGVSDEESDANYSVSGSGSSIQDEGEFVGKLIALDSVLDNRYKTFIKMDIEGSEMRALKGCSKFIRGNKPLSAIASYHNAFDLWEIPLYLINLVPEYKIRFENHTLCNIDIVCYANHVKSFNDSVETLGEGKVIEDL